MLLLLPALAASGSEPDATDPRPLVGEPGEQQVMWMRALRLDDITTTAEPDLQLRGTLISAEPRFRTCAEYLPEEPPEQTPPTRIGLVLWEEGAVRGVRVLDEVPGPLDRASRCLVEALQELRFPDDPAMTDDRRLELAFQARWDAANIKLVQITDEQRARTDVDDPSVEGRVDLVSISARIESIRPRLARCVRTARKRNPDLGTRITVRLRLAQNREQPEAPDAWLEGLSVLESDLGDEKAEVCIVRELERLTWPRPGTKSALVTWPFLFGK